jgi:hypothetical protein
MLVDKRKQVHAHSCCYAVPHRRHATLGEYTVQGSYKFAVNFVWKRQQ